MTNLAARLSKLTPTLTAHERAVLTIKAELAGNDPDPSLRRSMPRDQLTEYNRLVAYYYIANAELGTMCLSMGMHVTVLTACAEMPRRLRDAAVIVAEDLGEQLDEKLVRASRRKSVNVTVPVYLDGLGAKLAEYLAEAALYRWQELRAIEIVWDEMAQQLGEPNIVRSDLRQSAETAKDGLRALILEVNPRRKLPEPDEDQLEHFRSIVETVLHNFRLLEAT